MFVYKAVQYYLPRNFEISVYLLIEQSSFRGRSDSMPVRTTGTESFIPNACSKEVGKKVRVYMSIVEKIFTIWNEEFLHFLLGKC